MPDGHIIASEFEAMHDRLVTWGLCFLRGVDRDTRTAVRHVVRSDEGSFTECLTRYRDPEPSNQRRDWPQPVIDACELLHQRVIGLPAQRRLVLLVFYSEGHAETWNSLRPEDQQSIVYDLTHWRSRPLGVNARIDQHNREKYDSVPHIIPEAFMAIRHRAIRELMAREKGIPL